MLADYLKLLRQRPQLTAGQWAAKSGIARTTLWRWEQGKTLPRDHELCHALDALSVSSVERRQALQMLQQERLVKGVGSPLPLVPTGLKRNELLRALRLRVGWTQGGAAKRLGVNRVTLARWETGDHWPEAAMLHRACQFYGASLGEVTALITLGASATNEMPSHPDEVVWDDIETYSGDFDTLELRYLTCRAQLAQMPQPSAREREMACILDYLHSLSLQPRSGERLRQLRRIAFHPSLLASPALFARHRVLYAAEQKDTAKGNDDAEQVLRCLLDLGDAVPIGERYRAKAEWAERRASSGDREAALRLSAAAAKDARASDDAHLIALNQRQRTATLILVGDWAAAARALERFPTHTPLLAVQRPFTYALLLQKARSLAEATSAYHDAARAAQAAGMTGYASHFRHMAAAILAD